MNARMDLVRNSGVAQLALSQKLRTRRFGSGCILAKHLAFDEHRSGQSDFPYAHAHADEHTRTRSRLLRQGGPYYCQINIRSGSATNSIDSFSTIPGLRFLGRRP